MINIKDVPIGSMLKVVAMPGTILTDTVPLRADLAFGKLLLADKILLLLDYKEGIEAIHHTLTRNISHVFCTRVLVMMEEKKFWIVLGSTKNVNAVDLPYDLKDDFRRTSIFEIVEPDED